jgi:outer membrane protein assembly factor BamA
VAEFGAALVRDTTVFGPTGPLLGARYRVEVAPTAGHLRYTSVLADVRQYVMPVRPYTIAMRMVHAGRYGRDRHDSRLLPSYLGSSYFVRGHRSDLQYCTPDASAVCGEELLGNRLLVGNVELRFPLLGAWSRQIDYRVIPIDAFFFADAGVVSSRGGRTAISSIGAGLRTNAGGLPLEIGAVRALDGPRPRWQFDMGFRVGF